MDKKNKVNHQCTSKDNAFISVGGCTDESSQIRFSAQPATSVLISVSMLVIAALGLYKCCILLLLLEEGHDAIGVELSLAGRHFFRLGTS